MKKAFLLPLLFLCSFCFSQKTLLRVNGIPETGNGIEILSFSWGLSNPVSFGPGGIQTGRVSISSFNVMKYQDQASLKIIQGVATGKHFDEATITVFDNKGQPAFRFVLNEVFFESLQQSGSACGNNKCDNITESVSIAAAKWKWEDLSTNNSYQFDTQASSSF